MCVCVCMMWYIELELGFHPVAVVEYTFTHKQYIEQHNRHKQYIEQHNRHKQYIEQHTSPMHVAPSRMRWQCLMLTFLERVVLGLKQTGGEAQNQILGISVQIFLFNTVIYVLLLLCLCILIVCLCIFIVPAGTHRLPWLRVFRAFFLGCKANIKV